MIFNDDILYVHIGKTGGMSCSNYLLDNLKGSIYNCHSDADRERKRIGQKNIIPCTSIHRHATLEEGLKTIESEFGKTINDFKKLFAVIRHPITLEYSYFRHIQKPHVRPNNVKLKRLVNEGFKVFVEKGGYHRPKHPQELFLLLDGQMPTKMELIRFERLSEDFQEKLKPFVKNESQADFPHRNKSGGDNRLDNLLTPEVKELIYRKHQYMFDQGYYDLDDREIFV